VYRDHNLSLNLWFVYTLQIRPVQIPPIDHTGWDLILSKDFPFVGMLAY
jgi:hypothetical protein